MTPRPEDLTEKLRALVKEWTRRRDLMRLSKPHSPHNHYTYLDGLIDAHSDVLKDVAEHLPSLGPST